MPRGRNKCWNYYRNPRTKRLARCGAFVDKSRLCPYCDRGIPRPIVVNCPKCGWLRRLDKECSCGEQPIPGSEPRVTKPAKRFTDRRSPALVFECPECSGRRNKILVAGIKPYPVGSASEGTRTGYLVYVRCADPRHSESEGPRELYSVIAYWDKRGYMQVDDWWEDTRKITNYFKRTGRQVP